MGVAAATGEDADPWASASQPDVAANVAQARATSERRRTDTARRYPSALRGSMLGAVVARLASSRGGRAGAFVAVAVGVTLGVQAFLQGPVAARRLTGRGAAPPAAQPAT